MQLFNEISTNLQSIIRTIKFVDIIDILIIAFLIYQVLILVRNTKSSQILRAIFVFLVIYILASQAGLKTLSTILNIVLNTSVIAILVIFQPEIRKLLENAGKKSIFENFKSFKPDNEVNAKVRKNIMKISSVCFEMSSTKTGALIVIEKSMYLNDISDTGIKVNADISEEIIANIFFKNSPMHDGAMIIRENKIIACGCFLPLSQNYSISNHFGTRHRASMGITETTDCIVVVVSEETGKVSFTKSGVIMSDISKDKLVNILNDELLIKYDKQSNFSMKSFFKFNQQEEKK